MKQLFTSINAAISMTGVPYVNRSNQKFSRWLLVFGMACLAITYSSCTKEMPQNSRDTLQDNADMLQTNTDKAAKAKKTAPFVGEASLTVDEDVVSGTGAATQIGRFVYNGIDDGSNFPMFTGTFSFTATNGDKIFATHTGKVVELGGNLVRITYQNKITGGTGKFTGASGSFKSVGVTNTATWRNHSAFEGTITF